MLKGSQRRRGAKEDEVPDAWIYQGWPHKGEGALEPYFNWLKWSRRAWRWWCWGDRMRIRSRKYSFFPKNDHFYLISQRSVKFYKAGKKKLKSQSRELQRSKKSYGSGRKFFKASNSSRAMSQGNFLITQRTFAWQHPFICAMRHCKANVSQLASVLLSLEK